MKLLILLQLISFSVSSQVIGPSLPAPIKPVEKFLFYLHGGVVTVLGPNKVNNGAPEWGPYEYDNILDSLRKRGFNVISEVRKKDVDNSVYINKIAKQVDSLLQAGVPTTNIVLVGASAGWDIVLRASDRLKNKELNFVMMGGCWPDTYKEFAAIELYGRLLSIIEKSDPHGTCYKIFEGRKQLKNHKEITLNTGLSHGFFYKGRAVWMDPIMQWLEEQ